MEKKDIYEELIKPFPDKAYSVDSSRGFNLTSLKAQYIKERLNEVFGIFGWHFEEKFVSGGSNGVLCHGELVVYNPVYTVECSPKESPTIVELKTRGVSATGWSPNKKNLGDTYKGASTDALSKAASFIGIGNEVFKGNVNLSTVNEKPVPKEPPMAPPPLSDSRVVPDEPVCPKCGSPLKPATAKGYRNCSMQTWEDGKPGGCRGFVKVEPDDIPF